MMSPSDETSLDVSRERVVQALCHHFAHDRLDVAELERRLALAHAARTADALDALLAGLPAGAPAGLPAGPPAGAPAATAAGAELVPGGVPSAAARPRAPGAPDRAPGHPAASVMRIATIVSEARRDVVGDVPARIEVRAVLSDVKLDLSHARLGPVTDVDCVAVMSSVRVLVPPGVRVISEGLPLLGTFSAGDRADRALTLPTDAPVVRLRGAAIAGEVRAKVARG